MSRQFAVKTAPPAVVCDGVGVGVVGSGEGADVVGAGSVGVAGRVGGAVVCVAVDWGGVVSGWV